MSWADFHGLPQSETALTWVHTTIPPTHTPLHQPLSAPLPSLPGQALTSEGLTLPDCSVPQPLFMTLRLWSLARVNWGVLHIPVDGEELFERKVPW